VKSTRDQIRDQAEAVLRAAREPLHNSTITDSVCAALGLDGKVSAKTVNTCLHDDPQSRFMRVGAGTWTLKEFRR
jgi:hypothetical protein